MKTTLFTAGQVMACLMLLGLSTGESADASTTVEAVFNLKAMYKNVTCNQTLAASGDISGTIIDFGTFSSDSVDITKKVALTLDCANGTDLPDTVKVSFSVVSPATVDTSITNRLYPSYGNIQQTNLYYDWVWDEDINDTVKKSVGDSAHKTLGPSDKVDLSGASGADVYEVVSEGHASNVLEFPLKITRGVKETDKLAAGNYKADVKVTVSYE
ncbi:hypothetical protein R2E04_002438 [Salmonella enterica]|nr:hypothetical protein [Salmonella enterica subsp. enterica serovar Pensacola]EEB7432305.1 hypothetical protein [Salmonella enterica]EEO0308815.1 hypothetical protein [Salmonella enterica]EGM1536535.1 hypothetical protein [Salmonella enterica]EIC5980399.1 hypothetical protein [Salmonella enterica]